MKTPEIADESLMIRQFCTLYYGYLFFKRILEEKYEVYLEKRN